MKCTALCMCAALLPVGFLQAGTQQIEAPQEGSVISFHLENDMFVGDDDNYTNGVRFAWMSGTTSRSHTFSGMLGTVLGGTNASDSWRRFMGMNGSANLRQQWGFGPEPAHVHPRSRRPPIPSTTSTPMWAT